MGFNLADLFVTIKGDDSALQRQVGGLRSQLGAMGVALGTAAGNLAASAISGTASAIGSFLKTAITGAVSLQDTMSATRAIFGDSSKAIFSFADEMAAKFGAVKTETIGASQSFGSIFKAAGQSTDEAAKMGTTLAKLGMDLASFKGGGATAKEAFEAIQGSLQGNFQGNLDRFNIFLTMAEVNEKAVAMGLAKTTHEVDEGAKKLATFNLIMEKSRDQQGDLERTMDQTNNQWNKFTGTIQNAAQAAGSAMMPAINAVASGLADMATRVAAWIEENKASITSWGESIGAAIRSIPQYWDEFQAGVAIAYLRLEEFGANTLAWIGVLPENFARFGDWFANNWTGLIRDGAAAALSIFENLGTNLRGLWTAVMDFFRTGRFEFQPTGLLEGFKATVGELPQIARPALASLDDAVNAVGEDLARKTAARNQATATATAQAGAAGRQAQGAAAKAAEKEKDFKAETLGASDYFSKLREGVLSAKDDTARRQLDEQKKTSENTSKLVEMVGAGALGAKFA